MGNDVLLEKWLNQLVPRPIGRMISISFYGAFWGQAMDRMRLAERSWKVYDEPWIWIGRVSIAVVSLAVFVGWTTGQQPAAKGTLPAGKVEADANHLASSSRNTVATLSSPTDEKDFDGERAMKVLEQIVALGPRKSGSPAMKKQQDMLTEHFKELGADVQLQEFPYTPPSRGKRTTIRNLIVVWNPNASHRILICTHYDTRPYSDQDSTNKRGIMPGANDGASGAALLYELGRQMQALKNAPIGVDFVFFDAEEYVFNNRQTAGDRADPLFVGSAQFANEYNLRRNKGQLSFVYDCGVLLDMIGDKHLDLYFEQNSMNNPTAKQTAEEIWSIAQTMGFAEFHSEIKHDIRDDHIMLNTVGIPTCDIIDFDYPDLTNSNLYWHTQQDTPDKCSAESLTKVGSVLLAWIKKRTAQQ